MTTPTTSTTQPTAKKSFTNFRKELNKLDMNAPLATPYVDEFGLEALTLNHAYYSRKPNFNNPELGAEEARNTLANAYQAMYGFATTQVRATVKELVETLGQNPEWNAIKDSWMRELIWHKFSTDAEAQDQLISTLVDYPEEIPFQNSWGDEFWGVCLDETTGEWEGYNYYGKLLTMTRDILVHISANPECDIEEVKLQFNIPSPSSTGLPRHNAISTSTLVGQMLSIVNKTPVTNTTKQIVEVIHTNTQQQAIVEVTSEETKQELQTVADRLASLEQSLQSIKDTQLVMESTIQQMQKSSAEFASSTATSMAMMAEAINSLKGLINHKQ